MFVFLPIFLHRIVRFRRKRCLGAFFRSLGSSFSYPSYRFANHRAVRLRCKFVLDLCSLHPSWMCLGSFSSGSIYVPYPSYHVVHSRPSYLTHRTVRNVLVHRIASIVNVSWTFLFLRLGLDVLDLAFSYPSCRSFAFVVNVSWTFFNS